MDNEKTNVISGSGRSKALPLNSLIGKPLSACLSAQHMADEAAFSFIKHTAFHHSHEYKELLYIAMLSFSYTDKQVKYEIKVPLLTLIPLPYLQVDNVDFSFIANIQKNDEGKIIATYGNKTGNGWGYSSKTRYAGQMSFKVKVNRRGITSAWADLMEKTANNIAKVPYDASRFTPITKEEKQAVGGLITLLKDNTVGGLITRLRDNAIGEVLTILKNNAKE